MGNAGQVPDGSDPNGGRQPDRGRNDYHDPTAGIGGAPPARSALTLRMVLAAFGFIICAVLALLATLQDIRWLAILATLGAVVAAIDLVWVSQRKRRGEPG